MRTPASSQDISLSPPLNQKQIAYLRAFSQVKHLARHPLSLEDHPDPLRTAARLPVGKYGSFYVGDSMDGLIGDGDQPPGETIAMSLYGSFDEIRAWVMCDEPGDHQAHTCEWRMQVVDVGWGNDDLRTQPSVHCHWKPSPDGALLTLDNRHDRRDQQAWAQWIERWVLAGWEVRMFPR